MEFAIEKVAFQIGPLSVHWYGILLGLGAFTGLLLAIREGKRFQIPPDFFMDMLLFGVPAAIIGARTYYVIFEWDRYKDHFWDVFKVWEGGIAIHGALLASIIFGWFYVRIKGYNFWRIADIAAPSFIAGQMIGRWGNFVNQEAHGGPVSEQFLRDTLHLPAFIVDHMYIDGTYVHPTFLYESLWSLLGLCLLFWLRRRSFVRAGEIFLTYLIWYSIGRFYIEGLRTDSLAFAGPDWLAAFMNFLWTPMSMLFGDAGAMPVDKNIRMAQLIGLIIITVAIVIMVIRRQWGYANHKYSDPIQREGVLSGPVIK